VVDRVRISALATHPIQYHAPWFRALAAHDQVALHVLFEYLPDEYEQGAGFGVPFQWDLPLLDGYEYSVLSGDGPRSRTRSRARSLANLARHFAAIRPQVTLLTGWHSAVLIGAPTLAHRFGSSCMIRGESNDLKPRAPWMPAAHRLLLSRYERFLSIGAANRRFYVAHGIADELISDCPYFVDNDHFVAIANRSDTAHERARVRAQYGIAAHETCFVFVGKMEPKKRPGDLLAALRELRDLPVRVLFVGDGELRADLEQQSLDLPATFAGFVNQSRIAQLYLASDCIVLPSDCGETWGLVVNEAMACGRAAIVSDQAGCAADLVKAGQTGWCYPMGEVTALQGAMREALADKNRLAQMGLRAQAHVRAHFSVTRARDAAVRAALDLTAGAARV